MKLIDRYVAEVGRHLPEKQRLDIQNELRSTLEDALDDEVAKQGRAADEALAAEVLRRYGPPEKTAASYLPPRYLVGPELFPAYLKTLSSLALLLVLLNAIAFGAQLGTSADARANVAATLVQALTGLGGNLFHMGAIVTLAFAVYEWNARRLALPATSWDPTMLKDEAGHDPQRVNPLEVTFEMVVSVAALIIFNLYPQWVGLYWIQGGQWINVPMLAPAFSAYLPWLSAWWVCQIALDGLILAQRRRTLLIEWLEMGLHLLRLGLFFVILLGPAIIRLDPSAATMAQLGIDAQTLSTANDGLNTLVRVGLGILSAVGAVGLVRQMYRRSTQPRPALAADGAAHDRR